MQIVRKKEVEVEMLKKALESQIIKHTVERDTLLRKIEEGQKRLQHAYLKFSDTDLRIQSLKVNGGYKVEL